MSRLFALDHNFPQPIVEVLSEFQTDATLVRIDDIDERLPDLEDWELLLALHHHRRSWDGLITTDSSMLNQGPELATLIETKLTLVVAMRAGDNPVKASGLCSPTSLGSANGQIPASRRSGSCDRSIDLLRRDGSTWTGSPNTTTGP